MIDEKDYLNLKEMYDYKRKIEYNKEKIKKRIDKMYEEFEYHVWWVLATRFWNIPVRIHNNVNACKHLNVYACRY